MMMKMMLVNVIITVCFSTKIKKLKIEKIQMPNSIAKLKCSTNWRDKKYAKSFDRLSENENEIMIFSL